MSETTEPNLGAKHTRRTKAQIAADRAKEAQKGLEETAIKMRDEIAKGGTLKAKVASAVLALIGSNWDEIEPDEGQLMPALTIEVGQDRASHLIVKLFFITQA